MPVRFSDIARNIRNFTFEYDGDTFKLEYYPGRITDGLIARVQGMGNFSDGAKVINEAICLLVKSWDIVDDNDVMYPITMETLPNFPLPLKAEMVTAIVYDMRGEKKETGE